MTGQPRFTRANQYVVLLFIAIGFILFQQGCTVPQIYSYVGNKAFTIDNVNQLHTGMSPDEVRTMFGYPDKIHDASFGGNVGEPWIGRVWMYFTQVDRKFRYVKRYKKNVLVFYPPGEQMRLNHWIIEE